MDTTTLLIVILLIVILFGAATTVGDMSMIGGRFDIPRQFAALILACGALLFSFSVQASPIHFGAVQKPAPDVTLVRGFCGLGFHRGPYGYCVRNGTVAVPPVVVTPSPIVVAPSPAVVVPAAPVVAVPAAPVVVAPIACPYGYYLGPYGRCLPY